MIKKKLFKYGSVFMCAAILACSMGVYGASTKSNSVSTQEATAVSAAASYDSENIISSAINSQLANASKSTSSTTNSKEELVYVFANAAGVQNHVLVSDTLRNVTGLSTIEDVTRLKNITNMSGDETSTPGSDNSIKWSANGSSIIYQGTTSDAAPITMKVTYYLDGNVIAPEKLAGKSGKVTIRYEYTNNEKKTVTVNGKSKTVSVPFTMITGMMLPSDKFSNIEVTNGKISEMNDSSVVLGITMPGLRESLKLKFDDETLDMNIPEYFEVTADVKDFELDMSMSVATSNLLTDVNIDELSLDSLKNKMTELQDAANQLTDGTVSLQEGTQKISDSVPALTDGVGTLDNAAGALVDATAQLAAGGSALNDGAVDLNTGLNAYADGVSSAKTGAGSLNENMTAYAAAMQQLYDTLSSGDTPFDSSVAQLAAGATALNTAVNGETGLKAQLKAGQETARSSYATAYSTFYQIEAGIVKQQLSSAGYTGTALDTAVVTTLEGNGLSSTPDVTSTTQYAAATGAILENYSSMKTVLIGKYQAAGLDAASAASKAQSDLVTVVSGLSQAYQAYDLSTSTYDMLNQEGANNFFNGMATVAGGLTQLQQSVGSFAAYKEGTLCSSIYALNLNAQKLKDEGTSTLNSGLAALDSNSAALKSGSAALSAGTAALSENLNTLSGKSGELKSGTATLNSAAVQLGDGAVELNAGAITLKDGMAEFNETGIKSLTSLVGTDADNALDTLKAIVKAGQEYQSFAGKSDSMDGTVTFIYKTEGITK